MKLLKYCLTTFFCLIEMTLGILLILFNGLIRIPLYLIALSRATTYHRRAFFIKIILYICGAFSVAAHDCPTLFDMIWYFLTGLFFMPKFLVLIFQSGGLTSDFLIEFLKIIGLLVVILVSIAALWDKFIDNLIELIDNIPFSFLFEHGSQRLFPYSKKITKSKTCFKIYNYD